MAVLQPSRKDSYGSLLVHGPYSVLVFSRTLCSLLCIQAYPLFYERHWKRWTIIHGFLRWYGVSKLTYLLAFKFLLFF